MRAACGALLLLLASCAAPGGRLPSIAAPESHHEERLNRLFGALTESPAADPEAELSFQQSLSRSKVSPLNGAFIDVRDLGEIPFFSSSVPELPRPADYGLYANPIP